MPKPRAFVLGAGFSAGAGIPLTEKLLSEAMKLFKAECPGIFERVTNYAGDLDWEQADNPRYEKISFSELCTHLDYVELSEHAGGERWTSDGCRERLALRFFLAKHLASKTPAGKAIPKQYLDFATQLDVRDTVISLNWDCLLENALDHVGKAYSYCFEPNKVQLTKLHGSVNWHLNRPRRIDGKPAKLDWKKIEFGSKMVPEEFWASNALKSAETWTKIGPLDEVKPFLILPGYGKAHETRLNSTLWYRPGAYFVVPESIFVIGLSLSSDDHFLRSMFLNTLPAGGKRHVIVNPDGAVVTNYGFIMREPGSEFVEAKFDDAVVERIRAAAQDLPNTQT